MSKGVPVSSDAQSQSSEAALASDVVNAAVDLGGDRAAAPYVTQYLYCAKLSENAYLLFNTLTGAVDVVEKRVAEALAPAARCDTSVLTEDERRVLRERGYVLPMNDERDQVARWFADFKARMRSWHFIVCPTFTCNLRCHYCYEALEIRQSRTVVSERHVDAMFDAMHRLVEERRATDVNLEFFGGEPFLRAHRDVTGSIVARAARHGWFVSGITNGTQLDAYFDLFERHRECLTQIQITLDGPEAIHDRSRVRADGRGSYRAVCRNVSGLLERRVPVALRVNTGKDNVGHLQTLFSDFEVLGWTSSPLFHCQIAPINDHACTGCVSNYQAEFVLLRQLFEHFPDWEATRDRYHITLGYDLERRTGLLRRALTGKSSPHLRKHDLSGCSASNQHYVVFGADGLIYPCPETVGVTTAAVGRYFPGFDLDRAKWSKWDLNISNTGKCASCNIAPICGGACPWHGFNASSFDAYEPHCNYAQQTMATYLALNQDKLLSLIAPTAAATGG